MRYQNYTIEQVREAIRTSFSWRETIFKLGLNGDGGSNNQTFKKIAKEHNFDYSHFKGTGWSKGKQSFNLIPLNELLIKGKIVKSLALKKRLIKEGLLEEKCCKCGLGPEWNGIRLELQLDHEDGDNCNNELCNLRIICPNCHTQTPTYCRKKNKIKIKKQCDICHKEIIKKNKSGLCSCCFNKQRDYTKFRKVERPLKEILLKQVEELGYSGTGRLYGVSGTSIRKWLR